MATDKAPDPDLAAFESQLLPELAGVYDTDKRQVTAAVCKGDIELARRLHDEQIELANSDEPPFAGSISEFDIPGLDDDPPLRVCVYRHKQCAAPEAALVWVHGGGYLFGTVECMSAELLAPATTVVSVDYRLAPEHRAPAAARDVCAAINWVVASHAKLGIDPQRVAVGGGSAGGGAAASAALLNRDRGGPDLRLQLLVYPMLDDRHDTPAAMMALPGWLWHLETSRVAWQLYDDPEKSAYAAASRAADLTGLPPAYVMCGALDMFRDECISYAQRLLDAGTPAELIIYPGCPHAFDNSGSHTAVGKRAVEHYRDALLRACS